MSPKSLLRHPHVVSSLDEFQTDTFQEVLNDFEANPKAKRVVFCSGKIYFDLLEARKKNKTDVALVRIEQFYPFPQEHLVKVLSSYKKATQIIWCQEGPKNMGGWSFVLQALSPLLGKKQTLSYVGRSAQASPADGFLSLHIKEQQKIVLTALGEL